MRNTYTTPSQTITPSFSGHQTFPFRYTWLKKGIDAVAEDPAIFSSENASVTLGVGKNMVASIRHWCRASELITDTSQRGQFAPSELGKSIFGKNGFDPYLEDPATLWLIHYQITTNTKMATAWYWAFNILRGNQFTPPIFSKEVSKWARQQKQSMRPVSENTLRRDVNCFIRTYCQSRNNANTTVTEETFDCPLVELNLITELPDSDNYGFQRGDKETLPIEVVAWALDTFWMNHFSWIAGTLLENDSSQVKSLPFSDLMYAPSSPGQVFRLDEDTMTIYLEKLEQLTDGAFQYDETAGLKQLYRHKDFDRSELLERYYG